MRSQFFTVEKCQSTQEVARTRLQDNSNIDIAWVLSDIMSDGRGRAGRKWISLEGNLFLSCAARIGSYLKQDTPLNWPFVSLLGAYAWYQSCLDSELWRDNFFIKWPNDFWAIKANNEAAKVGGMLAEIKGQTLCFGIGVNLVNFPHELPDYTASALSEFLVTQSVDRESLARSFAANFEKLLQQWLHDSTASQERITSALWRQCMAPFQQMSFSVESHEGIWTPQALNPEGSLQVVNDLGNIQTVHAGDLTLLSSSFV